MITIAETKRETDFSLGKCLLIVGIVIGLAGGALWYFINQESAKEADKLWVQAKDELQNRQFDTGLDHINKAIQWMEKPEYLETKADLFYNQGKAFELEKVLERLMILKPKQAHYAYLAGNIAYNDGRDADALARYEMACKAEPGNTDYQLARANQLMRVNRKTEALRLFREIIRKDPSNPETWNQLALNYSNNSNYSEALAIRQEAIRQFPNEPLHYFQLGQLDESMGKKQNAVAAYRKSLELHPLQNSIAAERIFSLTGKRVPPKLEALVTDRVPFQAYGNLMLVSTEVNGRRGMFLVDTGASVSVVFDRAFSQYGLRKSERMMAVETAGGFINVPATYTTVRIGRYAIDNVMLAISPALKSIPGTDGIIGMNILQNFRMDVDHQSHMLVLNH